MSVSARAQNATKADNATIMSGTGSYVGGVLPGTSGTIFFNNTLTAQRTVNPGGITVAALTFENTLTQQFVFSSGSLTLGAGGLTKNDSSARTTIQSAFLLSAPQTWNINSSELQFGTGGSVTTNGNPLTIQGAGGMRFTGTTTLNSDVTIAVTGPVSASASTTNVTLQGLNTFDALTIGSGAILTGNSIGNYGVASALGDGGTNSAITIGSVGFNGTLIYSGTTASSNRRFIRTTSTIADASNAAIEVSTAGQTLTLSGSFTQSSSATNISGWRFGGAGNLTIQSVIPDLDGVGQQSIRKDGTGTLRLAGNNLYQGPTTVQAGVLLVDGSTTSFSTVSVSAAAVAGGAGTIGGNLTLANGAFFAFDPGSTLKLSGTLALDPSFGVSSLRSTSGGSLDWATIATGTYTPLNTTFSFNAGNISNFGIANQQTGLAGGKSAYFQQGSSPSSLQLVVVPEPATTALLGSAGVAAAVAWVKRRRARVG